MKILCLHGFGSSGKILEGQLAGLIRATDPTYDFVFVDGPVSAPRGPGVSDAIAGPYYSHTTGYTTTELEDAADQITSYIEDLGPFDGVIGFSQGAAQALSYLYQNQIDHHAIEQSGGDYARSVGLSTPPPFRFAVCFSSTIPISRDTSCYEEILSGLSMPTGQQNRGGSLTFASSSSPSSPLHPQGSASDSGSQCDSVELFPRFFDPQQNIFVECLTRSFQSGKKVGVIEPDFDDDFFKLRTTPTRDGCGDGDGDGHFRGHGDFSLDLIPRVMHPDLLPQRLKVPTVHITGKQDLPFMIEMSNLARGLCDPKLARVLQHSGGHSVPRKTSEIRQ
ncbi:MAG: hypothetical protein FRX48_00387 [Lasallia pustulata]|uniref:Serine hydrolase domain-containing protein n=1 Tax=Lasallia pustulata TaxID=136370 RepID=A0A5M8Q3L8_9LECA|nr:MAG: hypothetical protein FRX48_00387 [Lasallia pustulata]